MMLSNTETQSAILKAAREKFRKKGYNRSLLSEIAGAAGLSLKTMKKSFPTKKEIFRMVYDQEKVEVRKKLTVLFSHVDCTQKPDVVDTLLKLFCYIQKSAFLNMIYAFGDFPLLYCLQDSQHSGNDPLTGQMSLLNHFIIKCQNTGIMRLEDPALITHAFRNIFHLSLLDRVNRGQSKGANAILLDIFIDGLMASGSVKGG